jgi:hypothetical protein
MYRPTTPRRRRATTERAMFISEPRNGLIYIAEHSRRGSQKLLWSIMPWEPISADVRIEARALPYDIRRKAYRVLAKVAS